MTRPLAVRSSGPVVHAGLKAGPRSAPFVGETRPAAGQHPRFETEAQFQAAVTELARWRGWLVYFVPDSRRSPAGWPDLTLCRRGRLVMAELKSASGRLRPAQRQWLDALDEVQGTRVFVWKPQDWDEIVEVLT